MNNFFNSNVSEMPDNIEIDVNQKFDLDVIEEWLENHNIGNTEISKEVMNESCAQWYG